MSEPEYDIVVLGAGSGGYATALRASQLGMKVALIDGDKVGGTCLHRGCIPTKAYLHAAHIADTVRESETFGIRSVFEGIDMAKVGTYRDSVITKLYKGLQFAHRGFLQGIFVAEEIAGMTPAPINESRIPRATFCEPEIASVGLTEKRAHEKYANSVRTVEYNLAGNRKSNILNTQGFIKLVSVEDGPIVGFHGIGARIGEQIDEGELMVNWKTYPADVASLIHARPSQNESIGEAAMALADKPLHAHN